MKNQHYASVLDEILKLDFGISQSDNKKMFELLNTIHPISVFPYDTGDEHNGWIIPDDWHVEKALISKDGKVVFDGTINYLAVARHSISFCGSITKSELDNHVVHNKETHDAYPYHCQYSYRTWLKDWTFCIPYEQYKDWGDGSYDVELITQFKSGKMLVGESSLPGDLPQTILFCAHTCHTSQINDGLIAVAAILELFKRLASKKRKYTYKSILCPEHIGTVHHIKSMGDVVANIMQGCFVEMIGLDMPFTLQHSLTGASAMDRIATHALKVKSPGFSEQDYGYVGNDETVWESPGIEVPMISLLRWPYKEYHSDQDNLSIVRDEKFWETVDVLEYIVDIFEQDFTIQRQFTGLIALSNPKYNLYYEHEDPVIKKQIEDIDKKFAKMQDHLQRYFNSNFSVFEIANKFDIPFHLLKNYLLKFEKLGLVQLNPVTDLGWYKSYDSRINDL